MTQEEKQLLIKDLCARVPYRPKVKVLHVWNEEKEIEEDIVDTVYYVLPEGYINTETIDSDIPLNDNIILYLRPMSSMTEEELKQLAVLKFQDDEIWEISNLSVINNDFVNVKCKHKYQEDTEWTFQVNKRESLKSWQGIDWLNSHHFDYRGLIEKGLALEAPDGMYK